MVCARSAGWSVTTPIARTAHRGHLRPWWSAGRQAHSRSVALRAEGVKAYIDAQASDCEARLSALEAALPCTEAKH